MAPPPRPRYSAIGASPSLGNGMAAGDWRIRGGASLFGGQRPGSSSLSPADCRQRATVHVSSAEQGFMRQQCPYSKARPAQCSSPVNHSLAHTADRGRWRMIR